MSVLLVPESDLVLVAAYAAHQGLLAASVSPVAFAERLRGANRAFWCEHYGRTLEPEAPLSSLVQRALNEAAAIRPNRVMQTLLSLSYNSDLERDPDLLAALSRIMGRVGRPSIDG